MADIYMEAAGGLSGAVKSQLIPANIKSGVHLLGGGIDVTGNFTADANAVAGDLLAGKTAYVNGSKVTGELPANSTFEFQIPMYSNDGISIPAGYYPSPISVKPVYVSGTTFTDFSGSGIFGLSKASAWGGSNTAGLTSWYANANGCYMKVDVHAEPNGDAAYGGNARIVFQQPYSAPWDYCILRGSASSGTKVAALFYSSYDPSWSWGTGYGTNMNGKAAYSSSTPYLVINMGFNGTGAWSSSTYSCTISSITFYKNAT